MTEKIIEYKKQRLKITISEKLNFWELDEGTGSLIYVDDTDKVDETRCPNITEKVYEDLLEGIENEFKEIIDEDILHELPNYNFRVIEDVACENYESISDFNIELDVLD